VRVVAAFYPVASAASEVGGPSVHVENLTPPGVEPHDLEATPATVRKLREADHVLLLGHGFQPQLEEAAGNGSSVVYLLDTPGLALRDSDPHVWLDPLRYALIVKRIAVALGRPNAAAALVAKLHQLDLAYREGLRTCKRREIVTSHAAFGYLADRYRLRQVAITGITPEAEPRPQDLKRVIDAVRATRATTIFFEPLVSPKLAETVARATGAKTAVLNPIEGLTADEQRRGENYFTLMQLNLRALRAALGCR
jgi:ABC-type metal ion transport system, periplasmic component/surface adhesin